MSLLVVGSLALDTIETIAGTAENTLGGSATFVSTSASYLTNDIRLVGIVGYDFPIQEIDFFKSRNIDTEGLVISKDKKTFHWHGKYDSNLDTRLSIKTELNAFEDFDPVLDNNFRHSEYICLGNVNPEIQKKVIEQLNKPEFIMIDTMNFWIEGKHEQLMETLKLVDMIVINDSEAVQLSGEKNLLRASDKIKKMGPTSVIIKKGENGAMLFKDDFVISLPSYPTTKVIDTTGAGDTFAGGFMGWISRTRDLSFENLKIALAYGTVLASYAVENFSLDGIRNLNENKINERMKKYRSILNFKLTEL